jgi:hypothetical protein
MFLLTAIFLSYILCMPTCVVELFHLSLCDALMSYQVTLLLHLFVSLAAYYWPCEDLSYFRATSMILFNCMSSVSVTVYSNSLWAPCMSLISCFSSFWEALMSFITSASLVHRSCLRSSWLVQMSFFISSLNRQFDLLAQVLFSENCF